MVDVNKMCCQKKVSSKKSQLPRIGDPLKTTNQYNGKHRQFVDNGASFHHSLFHLLELVHEGQPIIIILSTASHEKCLYDAATSSPNAPPTLQWRWQ
jgi:hypothetical protein